MTVFLPHQRAARYMAKVRAAAGGSIFLPKIVQAEFCASFRQARPRAREGPLPVTVVPAGVKLGSSFAPPPAPASLSIRITAGAVGEQPQLESGRPGLVPLCPSSLSHQGPGRQPPSLSFLSCEMDTEAATSLGSCEGQEHQCNVPDGNVLSHVIVVSRTFHMPCHPHP